MQDPGTIFLIIVGIVLLVVLLVVLGGGMAMGGMAMMAGMMGTPVGWAVIIILGLLVIAGYIYLSSGA